MGAPRFFVKGPLAAGVQTALAAEDVRHAALVLRLNSGDAVVVVANNQAWQARIVSINSHDAIVTVIAETAERTAELPQAITILQALPKGNKMDYVIEKVVELGAARIVPVHCARSYAGASENKLERWRKIARAAAEQSRRLVVPDIEVPITWEVALQRFARRTHILVAHETAAAGTLAQALGKDGTELTLAVGPEGSFTQAELDAALRAGADIVSLGATILRTETAAVAMLAGVACLRKWW